MPSGTDEEPFLYLRKENEEEVHVNLNEDNWDDTLLVRAYDKAVSDAKRQIVKKLEKELNLTKEEVNELCDVGSAPAKSEKTNKKSTNKSDTKKNRSKESVKGKWKVGSKCRAIYIEDGEEYEAEIIEITSRKSCLIRYFGYENEEIVDFSDLLPSHGKDAIKQQIIDAQEEEELEEVEYEEDESGEEEREFSKLHEQKVPTAPFRAPFLHESVPLPPHPPLPGYHSSNPLADVTIPPLMGANQAENALLISWFMCGYHTGYYRRQLYDEKNLNG